MTNKIDFQIDFFCPSSISYKFEEKLTLFFSNELYALVIPKIRLNEKKSRCGIVMFSQFGIQRENTEIIRVCQLMAQ